MATTNTNNVPVINPYKNVEVIQHKKYISHLGVAFVDLKTIEQRPFKSPRTILRSIAGQVNYGTFNAILGPRQSGKTTLLKTLVGRNNQNVQPETQFFVNPDIPPKVVYFDQEIESNILFSLTVVELLEYSFRFRNVGTPSMERNIVIKDLLKNFDLLEIRDEQLLHCTPEERIKAEIAMALSSKVKPNLIMLDEPLHNIDAVGIEDIAITFSVGQILDSDILAVFDKLYVLSRGGLCIYEGSVEHLSLFLRECDVIITSKIQTPIERLMKIASKPNHVTIRLAKVTVSTRDEILHNSQKFGIEAPNGVASERDAISMRNIVDLFSRSFIHKHRYYWRSLLLSYIVLVVATILLSSTFDPKIGVPSGCFERPKNSSIEARFVITGKKSEIDTKVVEDMLTEEKIIVLEHQNLVDQNVRFLFVICIALTLFQVVVSVKGLNEEVRVATNEHRNGWINIVSFFIVKNILDLIIPLINTISVASLAFLLTHQVPHAWRFGYFIYGFCSLVIAAQSLGFVIGIIAVFNARFTVAMMLISYIILVVFSGYLIPLVNFQKWIELISYISFMKESYEIILLSLYGLNRCEEMGFNGSYVLEEFGIDNENGLLKNTLLLLAHIIVCRFAFLQIVISKVNKQRQIKRPPPVLHGHDDEDAEFDVDRY